VVEHARAERGAFARVAFESVEVGLFELVHEQGLFLTRIARIARINADKAKLLDEVLVMDSCTNG
jgi:hypothetical protein